MTAGTSLDLLTRAERMLAQVATVKDAKDAVAAADLAAELARRIDLGTASVNHALCIKAKAQRRLADIVDAGQQAGEIRTRADNQHVRGPDKLPIPRQRLAEARRIRDTFTDDDLDEMFAEATDAGRELPTSKLIAEAKHGEREREKRERASVTASAAPEVARITRAPWQNWLPGQPECDLLLTDPPYSTDVGDIEAFAGEWLPAALGKVRPTGRAYVCIGAYPDEVAAYLAVKPPAGIEVAQILVWTYRNTLGPSPSHDYKLNWQAVLYYRGVEAPPLDCPEMVEQFSVQDLNAPDGRHGTRWHAWQKPDELAERFVRHASRQGDLVLDPFAGTGTFLLAAARLGRRAAGCERDPEMADLAQQRGCQRA